MRITVERTSCNFEREALIRPFGFKGGYMGEMWQTAARLTGASGESGLGICTQNVLWSDPRVFASHSESAGNALMFAVLDWALTRVEGQSFETPIELLERLLPEAYAYAKGVCRRDDLKLTFVLNALVGFDNAAWMLYCREKGYKGFDEMIGAEYRAVLPERHGRVACIPLIAYGIPIEQVRQLARDGYFFLKIKIGSDPEKDGSFEKMLEWDCGRLSAIHEAVGGIETAYTDSGRIAYYLDANGRYDSKDRLRRLLDHAKRIGAFERVVLVEEPFAEEYKVDVSDLGVMVAADESAHSDEHARERIELGYGAIALKPTAKTMSMSLKTAKAARSAGVPCFCADLTVSPILVDWNKNVASRLPALPGLKIGAFETNGDQNYRRWDELMSFHPCAAAQWTRPQRGVFHLDGDFYARSGGILEASEHYGELAR